MKPKIFATLLVCFLLIASLAACRTAPRPSSSNLILYTILKFTSMDQRTTSVYVVSPPDGEPLRIYQVDYPASLYAWFSPDGKKVIVLSQHPLEQAESTSPTVAYTLVTMDSSGENPVTWFEELPARAPACPLSAQFSNDSQVFLFIRPASQECEKYQLFTARADGKEQRLVDEAAQLTAEFSPKNDRLLVSRQVRDVANKKTVSQVYYVDVKGGEPQIQWENQQAGYLGYATYGGGDRVLLQVANFMDAEAKLFFVSDDFTQLTSVAKIPGPRAYNVIVSADASYVGLAHIGEKCNLFSVIEVASGTVRDISCWNSGYYQFSSNGKYLFVPNLGKYGNATSIGFDKYLLKTNGDLIETFPGADYRFGAFSPDGNRLVYWFRDSSTETMCLNIRDLGNGQVTRLDSTCVPEKSDNPGETYWK